MDDGAKNLAMSLEMARMACADGITTIACTPHIQRTVYDNDGPSIHAAVGALQRALEENKIPLRLVAGADIHVDPELTTALGDGRALTLNASRYLLLEPPHHVLPPNLEDHIFNLHATGYIAIITHPERMTWIDANYSLLERLVHNGAWMQLTAGSITGRFGRRPKYWSERILKEGLCHLIATDAHNTRGRPPFLAEARQAAANWVGDREATNLVVTRPQGIIDDVDPAGLPALPESRSHQGRSTSGWRRFLRRATGKG